MSASTAGSTTAVSYQGSFSHNPCGYCNEDGCCSFYLRAQSLTVRHYQCLVDRGWRRSGHTLYKPHMKLTCCKHYTIRLNADSFRASRDQRKCLHKWTTHVLGEVYIQESARQYPKSKEEKKKRKNVFDLSDSVHAPEFATIEALGHIPPNPAHKFEVTLEHASFSEEKYELFENYQRTVHHERPKDIRRGGFKQFLCYSPLETRTTSLGKKLGSWHQCYRFDGRLIAMGVLDLLPTCVSGVYFIYHSDFEKWNLGKVSACREASLAKEGGYQYYYMGYYIPSCQKMKYKGEYDPSELLNPGNNQWMPLDDTLKKQLAEDPASAVPPHEDIGLFEEHEEEPKPGFCIRSRMPGLMTPDALESFELGETKIFITMDLEVKAKDLRGFDSGGALHDQIQETVAAVGPDVAAEMILSL